MKTGQKVPAIIYTRYSAPAKPDRCHVRKVLFHTDWGMHLTAMMVIFAIGIQNAFDKRYAKETYSPPP